MRQEICQKTTKKRTVIENILASSQSELANGCRRYLEWMAVKNYSPRTITGHYYGLNFFLHWCLELGLTSPEQISCQIIKLYELHILQMTQREERPIGVCHHHQSLYVVKVMFNWLMENGIIDKSPAENIELPKLMRHIPQNVLGHNEIEEILSQPDIQNLFGLRDRAIFELVYSTGIRRKEIVGLQVDDINLRDGVLFVREGKGAKQRIVPVGQRAIAWLTKYLYEVRPILLKNRVDNALFLTYKGTGITTSGLANRITPYIRTAGQTGCCHIFRHAMATSMLENGANISSIQEMLGHEQLSSTQVYTHVAQGKLREVYDNTHPANTTKDSTPPEINKDAGNAQKPLYKWGGQPFSRKKTTKTTKPHLSSVIWKQARKYLEIMAKKGMSPGTIRKRQQHLKRFLSWCDLRSIKQACQITHTLIERYHKDLYHQRHKDKPLAPAYIGRHLVSIRCFFAYLKSSGSISYDPAQKIKLPKKMKTIPYQILSQEEIEEIFAQVDTTELLGVRDRVILEIFWATGIRLNELCRLLVEDIDIEQKTVHICSFSSRKERTVPITTSAQKWLETYLSQVRPKLVRQENQRALLVGRYGSTLNHVTVAERVKHYLKKAEIKKPGACDIFRHSLATAMLENGADIRHIQHILGHLNLSSTQIYTKVSIRKLKEVHSKTHPASELIRKNDNPDTTKFNGNLATPGQI